MFHASGRVLRAPYLSLSVPIPLEIPPHSALAFARAPAMRREVQELATPSKTMLVPEWLEGVRSHYLQQARDILRNPSATEEEKAIAQARIRENQ
jgi:hypothetical protein